MKIKPKELRKHFVETIYNTLDGVVSPTPYLEIDEGDQLQVRFLDGEGRLPSANTTEITALDINLSTLFLDDIRVLWEGITGVGKTYTVDAIGHIVFGPDGHDTIRLSGGVMGSSAFEPFTTIVPDNGVPKTHIDPEKCQKYGLVFIDEINRGDCQESFQVIDRVIHLNGETGYLRIPIPGTDRYKGLVVIAAMNPPDAQHSAATELDLAGENRFLRFRFPNGVTEAGSSQLEKKLSGDLHKVFWNDFRRKTGFSGTWKEIYPIVTDPLQLQAELDGATREFIDVAIGYVGQDPKLTYERNLELMKQGGLKPSFSIRKDNNYDKIIAAQKTLKHGFVRRDLPKIGDLSRLLAFIKSVKQGTYEPIVTINDAAASMGIALEGKTITGTEHGKLMTLVNDAKAAYSKLMTSLKIPLAYGMRQAAWQAAVNAGQKNGFAAYLNTLKHDMEQMNAEATDPAQATLKSRLLADLVVLEHFSKTYETEVTDALKSDDPFVAFEQLYDQKKRKASVYELRLESIIR